MTAAKLTAPRLRRALLGDLGRFTHDPLGFVRWAFPWGVAGSALAGESGPEAWQRDQLAEFGARLRADPYRRIQDSTASGHGIGKSAQVAWLILWALMTHERSRGIVTANTESQLRTKTWAELAKWYGLLQFDALKAMFKLDATSLHATEAGQARGWRVDAVAWSERNAEAFAGLHNAGKRILLLFDEASAIADPIWETAEGALTDARTEIIWAAYGNPTRGSGRFRETIAGRFRDLWTHRQIDAREVGRTNKAVLADWERAYGADSDFFRVRVRGQFARAASTQLISSELVHAARTREIGYIASDPVVFGVDVARFGDDHSTLAIRRGRDARSFPWQRWHGADSMRVAGDIAIAAERYRPDAIFVDGGAMGAGVIDRLRQLNVPNVHEVLFGASGREACWSGGIRVRTVNKRAEMWVNGRAWLSGGAIPNEQAIEDDLTGVEYGYGPDQVSILLERKEHMKARGLASPDDADALMLTFAEFVRPREVRGVAGPGSGGIGWDYDRYAELRG